MPQQDRHGTSSKVVSIRIPIETYVRLHELIANSPLPHDTVGGYIAWLILNQALRKR